MTATPTPLRRSADAILIAIFAVAIALPLTSQAMGWGRPPGAPKPSPALRTATASAWTFPDRFSTWYADRFAFRAPLIRWHARTLYQGLGVSPSETVMLGKDGWLYYAGDNSMDDHRSRILFTDAELARWRSVLEARRDWLAARHIRFLAVFVPDKHVIYPEYLPDTIRRVGTRYRIDQLADYLQATSTLDVVNVRSALEAAKKIERIYHKTDSHWNDRGALAGYQQIVARLTPWFPNVRPLERAAFQPVARASPGWDIPEMLGLADLIPEEELDLEPHAPRRARVVQPLENRTRNWNDGKIILEVDDPSLPRLVMLRDSFASALVPFLGEHFRRSVFFWESDFDIDLIEEEKPDVVILEIAGRKLYQLAAYNPERMKAPPTQRQ